MSDVTIESLQIEVESTAAPASKGIDALTATLTKLKSATKGGLGLAACVKNLKNIGAAADGIDSASADKLGRLTEKLSTLGQLKISSSLANQMTKIKDSAQSLLGVNFSPITELSDALTPLANMNKSNLSSFTAPLEKLPAAVSALESVDTELLRSKTADLAESLKPLSEMGKSNLTPFVTQIGKIPEMFNKLKSVDIGGLAVKIKELADAFKPLGDEMAKISAGFSAMPARLQRLIQSTNNLNKSNKGLKQSFTDVAAKIGVYIIALKKLSNSIGSAIIKSNKYIEDLNLFEASMRKFADNAAKYADKVSEIMGIDPADWMRNQGIFMTLATGFGVAGDRAEIMSRNLTQLGYDIGSFFNLPFEQSMLKLQSGLSGELEPLRRIGYDLSVSRLQQEAYTLGIKKKVQAMTQAEKAELRYYAIMTQVTTAQGDMARTLETPSNQLRILKMQLEQCARAFGNIFIPALNKVLPYAIALAKVLRMVADSIAKLVGFKLPEIDYSGLDSIAGGGVGDALGDAADNAKKLKNNLIGIDELNIISKEDADNGLGNLGGGGLGFELPEYDFLGDAVNKKVDDIVAKLQSIIEKLKDWLGLSEPIKSWADFMQTRLYDILSVVGAIAAGLLAWNIMSFLKNLGLIHPSLKQMLGIALAVAGAVEFVLQYLDGWVNGIDWSNLLGQLGGMAAVVGGLGLAFGKVGAGIGLLVTGLAEVVLGIKDIWENGLNLPNMLETSIGAAATILGSFLLFGIVGAAVAAIPIGIAMLVTGIRDALLNGLDWLNAILIPAGATLTGAGIGAIIGLLGGPIGAGIGALIGLAVGALVDLGLLIHENWDAICDWFVARWDDVKNFFTQTIPSVFNNFVTFMKGIPVKIGEVVDSIKDWFSSLPEKIATTFSMILTTVIVFFTELPGKVAAALSTFVTSIVTWCVSIKNKIVEEVPKIINAFIDFWKGIPAKLLSLGKDIVDGFLNGIKNAWNTVTTAVKNFISGFIQGFKDALGIASPSTVLSQIGRWVVDGFLNGIKTFTNIMSTIKEWAEKVVEWFTKGDDGKGLVEHFKESANNIVNGFKDKIGSAYTTAKTNLTTWASSVKDWFTSSSHGGVNATNFATYAGNVINGFKDKIGSAYTTAKTNLTTWASSVKDWFTSSSHGGVNATNFATYAGNVINGFKDKIGSAYTTVQSSITAWGSSVINWFEEHCSYDKFYNVAADVINGFKNGIGALYGTVKSTISSWGSSIISWFKDKLDSNSPSKVFETIGIDTVIGYNLGIGKEGKKTKGVMSDWFNSFGGVNIPSMRFAVDTSALRYYDSASFARSISSNVTANTNISSEGFKEAMREFWDEYLSPMADDVRRQADKKEQTIVQVGNRTITDAVVTQQDANGYRFVTA